MKTLKGYLHGGSALAGAAVALLIGMDIGQGYERSIVLPRPPIVRHVDEDRQKRRRRGLLHRRHDAKPQPRSIRVRRHSGRLKACGLHP